MLANIKLWFWERKLPQLAKDVLHDDRKGLSNSDPGCDRAIDAMSDWLCHAQDNSKTSDGGVARDYSLVDGWASSYPETTGYIIPTMLRLGELLGRDDLQARAIRMLNWCRDIQLPEGGFQGGKVDATPVVPVTFNTGQILLGLAAGAAILGDFHESMHGAARFLRDSLDDDGCWRRHPTPFAAAGEKAYETHVSWGLFEADRVAPGEGYGDAGMRQVRWAMRKQQDNGWVADCCLNKPDTPLTHTLGYYLKGLVEAHRWSDNRSVLDAALSTATGLLGTQREDGALPGRLHADWRPAVSWSCLTGNVQIADSWFYLAKVSGDERFVAAAKAANRFVRRSIRLEGPEGIRGGVQGAFPVDGDYGPFEYLNWAAKFAIDANLTERAL
ncbi:MAG: hypothetical protein QNJ11_20270 [Woeseiaceae bacterium]|nr:hypothetical protein [Woeseiaceae bacterium]